MIQKKKVKDWIDKTTEEFTKTNITLAINSLVMISILVVILSLECVGVKESLIEGYFQLLVILFLGYISISVSNFHILDNGYLGLGNGIYLFFAFGAIFSGEFLLLEVGANFLRIIWVLTIVSFIYQYFNKSFGGSNKWLLKSRKQ